MNVASNSPNGIIGNTCNTSNNSQSQAKAKSTKRQKEKNVRVFKAGDIPCNCGDQDINTLVSFINNDNSSNEIKNKKIKKKDKEKDVKSSVLKKSSSLEELRSCTKLSSDDNYNVTLRSKGIKQKSSKSNSNTNVVRKGERRSWGTEELPYYDELNVEDTKPKKKSAETKIQKKDVYCTEIHSKGHSMESINSEPSDFLLVTKKKKPKKRQTVDDSNFSSNQNYTGRGGVFIKKNGQTSDFQPYRKGSNLTSDKEYYYNSQSVNNSSPSGIHNPKSRRKSTSSMPPSDKSDLSDSDSVHSLPVENKKSQNSTMKQKNQKNQPQSYAEITKRKKSQGNITTITATANLTINCEGGGANTTKDESLNNKTKPKTKHKTVIDFPELVPTAVSTTSIVTPQQISYSQSLVSPALNNNEVTSPTLSTTPVRVDYEFIQPKQVLYKSKSMDNDSNSSINSKNNNSQSSNNLLYNSIDQYPALENPVKRHCVSQPQAIITYINNDFNRNESKLPSSDKLCAIEANKITCNQISSKIHRKSCSSNTASNKNLNRPAVVILYDDLNQIETAKLNQFTFGDFKEDELRFLGKSEEPTLNLNSTFKSSQDIDISLESDNGYSSSLNQSAKAMESAFMHEEDSVTTDSQNNIRKPKSEKNRALIPKNSLRNKTTNKIITCSEIEDSLTSQINALNTGINFNFTENTEDEDECIEEDETNATTSTNNGDDDNDAIGNENNIELDISTVHNKASCTLSFKPPPKNILLPSHNERIIDFIGSGKKNVFYIACFLIVSEHRTFNIPRL